MAVAIIDYGSGNLRSVENAVRRAAAGRATEVATTAEPEVIAAADRIVLPGVGAFSACMSALAAADGVLPALEQAVRARGVPFLGICVGMQLMAERGLEHGASPGLGWIAGEVARLAPAAAGAKIPHVGWNAVEFAADAPLFADLSSGIDMYFTHSFAFAPAETADVAAWSDHGGRFAAAVVRDNLAGVQFHPEKSQGAGLRLLANFLSWRP
jgi:glutamine amidotransferase